ncbi:sialic acid-binding Ig-like lectin 14 [Chanodichthys erythropterus]|uniref:sialic acid-binding Ig-like lectin 14 n=1 Tax=Chanodichthys erythropterus TaxID=933992 RepID=UPI00351E03E2
MSLCLLVTQIYLMLMLVRMAPALPLIFLLMIHRVSSAGWGVSYSPSHICALKDSSVIMNCTYTYPTEHQIMKVLWTKGTVIKGEESPDLSEDPEYSRRLQYLGDKQQNCTIRLNHVTLKDSHMYYFRFTTNVTGGKWIGRPGVTLTVTDLQVESPERVTEGDSVRLTCKSSCTLTDRATFIWYRNSQPLTERRDRNNELLLQSVRREDAGRYSCAVHGHNHISPAVQINVMYEYRFINAPMNVSVSISPSGEIVSGDSVTLICSSDSNPPALNFSWFKENESSAVGSGQSFSALQSGRFYCQAHNQHGSQRSDAVTVTEHHRSSWHKVFGITVECGAFFILAIIIIIVILFIIQTQRLNHDLQPWSIVHTPNRRSTTFNEDSSIANQYHHRFFLDSTRDCMNYKLFFSSTFMDCVTLTVIPLRFLLPLSPGSSASPPAPPLPDVNSPVPSLWKPCFELQVTTTIHVLRQCERNFRLRLLPTTSLLHLGLSTCWLRLGSSHLRLRLGQSSHHFRHGLTGHLLHSFPPPHTAAAGSSFPFASPLKKI